MTNLSSENTERPGRVLMAFFVFGVLLLALRPIDDFDTFWQLQSGRYMVQTGAFIYKDIFSLAADAYRMEHCWLHDLILYALYSVGGYPLLALLLPTVIALCGALLYRWNLRRGGDPSIVLPALLLCLIASEPSWAIRPQLWTFLFSLIYLHLLHRGREEGLRAWLWLAPIMLLWANLHAGCVFGLVLIGLFGAAELVRIFQGRSSWTSLGRLSLAGLATFAVAFINPYGYRIPLGQLLAHMNQYKVQTGSAPSAMLGNMEWLPPTFELVPLFYVVVALWGLLILCRLRRLDPFEGIFFLALVYMGFGQIRHTTLVALLAGFYLPMALQEVAPLFGKFLPRLPFSKVGRWGAMLLLGVLVAGRIADGGVGWRLDRNAFPVAATDFLKKEGLPTNLYNAYDWGGYLMWRLYPDYLVFVDGRQDSSRHFDASNRIDNLWPGWEEELDRFDINTVITRTCYYDTGGPIPLVDGLARHPGWALVYRDEEALIFLRRNERFRPLWERLALPPKSAYETMHAEATRLYEEDRSRGRALLALGRSSLQLGRTGEALGHFRRFLAKYPDDREASLMVRLLENREASR